MFGLTVAGALHALDEAKGYEALNRYLTCNSHDIRLAALEEYARNRGGLERKLLSIDLDGVGPWIDHLNMITKVQVVRASKFLKISTEEVRSLYEAMSIELNLQLEWHLES